MLEPLHETDTVTDIDTLAKLRVGELAAQIKTNRQLQHIIRSARRDLQRGVYDEIAPYLRFKPWPFERMVA